MMAAVGAVARPGLPGRLWRRRYELGLAAGLVLGSLAIGYALGPAWLIAPAAVLTAAVLWPPRRRRVTARARCVTPPRRLRPGRAHGPRPGGIRIWIQTRDGRLPAVIYTIPAGSGERVWLWCHAVLTAGDLLAARDALRAACWASDIRVIMNDRRSQIVLLEAIRHLPAEPPGPEERTRYGGLGHQAPFG